ncbi:MAG: CRTAC1 family protein [Acidimicrobiia bacterium]|nr:CRTAC1 family protein [Acidimicrobiia bacterium]
MEAEPEIQRGFTGRGWWLLAGAVTGAVGVIATVALAVAVFAPPPPEAGPVPTFVEEAAAAGLTHTYDGDFSFYVGGGVAVFDCDDDGFQDMYLAGGSGEASLFRNVSPAGGRLRFAAAGDATTDLANVVGAYPIDIDSDEAVDLMVLRLGENVALRGLGDCRFERANETWGIDGGNEWTAAFSAKWEDGNELPTLAFGNYLEWPVRRDAPASCADNVLLRPAGDVYAEPTVLSPGWCTLSVLFSQWGESDQVDLRVANDRHYYIDGSEQMWRVAAGEEPRLYTAADGWHELKIWGMGIASQDLTGDVLPEFFITSQGDNKLQTLEAGTAGPSYRDIAIDFGVTAHRPFVGDNTHPSTAWHPEFQDVNNDGFLDLFITKGNVEASVGYAMADPNNLLIGQPDGTFVEGAVAADVASTARSRGAALADFNLDGLLDLVVVNRSENVQLWRNVGTGSAAAPEPTGNWLALNVRFPATNTDSVGATIRVAAGDRIIDRTISIGGGHAGDQLGWVHFGLGDAETASVTVTWDHDTVGDGNQLIPEDASTSYADIESNRFVVLEIGQPAEYWTPPDP